MTRRRPCLVGPLAAAAFALSGATGVARLANAQAQAPAPKPSSAVGAGAPAGATAGAPSPTPRRDPLSGAPRPALFVTQAQFVEKPGPDGKTMPIPGPAKLTILRLAPSGAEIAIIEDPA